MLVERAIATVRRMVRDRGYTVQAAAATMEALDAIQLHHWFVGVRGDQTILVVFPTEEKLSIKTTRHLLKLSTVDGIVAVLKVGATPFAHAAVQAASRMEIFVFSDVVSPVVDHVLVPPHRLLNASEKDRVMSTLRVQSTAQLPSILMTDPVAKYFGARIDDVFEISRKGLDGRRYTYYRAVV